jgi:FdhD protein
MHRIQVAHIDISVHKLEQKIDFIAEEKPLHIFLNDTHYATILCSPTNLKELAVGYLLTEGIVKAVDEISEIQLGEGGKCQIRLKPNANVEQRISITKPFSRLVISACGSPDYWPLSKLIDRLELKKLPLGFVVDAKVVLESVRRLNILAVTYRKTGGVHVAAIYSAKGELQTFAEDVGRHNAVDKVIGIQALKHFDFTQCFLASSGRLTGDIVLKAARVRIPVVSSLAGAVDSGVEVAERTGLTLIGFVRGTGMNIFAYPERIVYETDNHCVY